MKTTQDVINNVMWKACDTFRGTMDSSQYKDYILSMLFVKYLSDFYQEKLEYLNQKYEGDSGRVARALKREKFNLDDTCTFKYLLKNKEAGNLGEIINKTLMKIQDDNSEKLKDIFRNVDFNSRQLLGDTKERNIILKNLLEDFSDTRLDLRPSQLDNADIIGNSYEYLIAHFANDAGKKGGEFFTPSSVSSLLAKLVSAKEGDTIYDPTCGSGSLLIKAAHEVGNNNFAIFGQEKNGQTHSLCRMNMYLHEINDAKILCGDTISNPQHLDHGDLMKFDVIVANPPFSLDKWGADIVENDIFKRFMNYPIPPKTKGDYAFVIHMIQSLKDNGRMGIVLPHGVLFRGSSEGKIRQKLIHDNLLDAIIGLPANLFFGTSIPACILIFKKNRTNTDIMFIDASHEFEKNKNQNLLTDTHLEKILNAYRTRTTITKYSYLASLDEVKENDYNLNIPRYVDTFEEEEEIDLEVTKNKITTIEAELLVIRAKMNDYLNELGVI